MSLLNSLIGPVTGILDKVIEDKDQKAKLAHEIATMSDTHAQQALLAQLEINLILFGVGLSGATIPPLPEFDMSSLMTVLMGMLGLGGLRTYEKQKGLTK